MRTVGLLVILAVVFWGGPVSGQEAAQDGDLVKVRMLTVGDKETAQQIYEKLQQGGEFVDLAKSHSVGPNAANGGYIGAVDLGKMEPDVSAAISALQPGQSTAPFKTGDTYSLFQRTTDAHYEKGRQLFAEGQFREAGKEFVADLRLNPDSAYSLFYIGLIHSRLGNMDKAVSAFERSLEQNEGLVETYYNLAIAYRKQGMADKAVEMYKKAIALDPNFHPAHNNLAWLFTVNRQNLEEALALIQKAISLAPDEPDYYDTLSRVYFEMGENDEAVAQLNKAISLSPDNEYYRQQLERYHMAGGQAVAAVSLEEVPEAKPESGSSARPQNGTGGPAAADKAVEEQPAATATSQEAADKGGSEKPASSTQTASSTAPKGAPSQTAAANAPKQAASQATSGTAPKSGRSQTASATASKSAPSSFTIEVRNGSGRKGAAQGMAEKLQALSYNVAKTGNAGHFNWERTTVFYKPAVLDQALALAHKLEGEQDVLKMKEESPFDVIIVVGQR